MNLFGIDIEFSYVFIGFIIIFIMLLIFDIVQFVKIANLGRRIDALTEGSDGKSLESEMAEKFAQISELKRLQSRTERDVELIFKKLKNAYQKSSVYKYDALQEMGGKVSSVIVMLDEGNNGFLTNSVHSTTGGSYFYVKEIINGSSDVLLSKEEEIALEDAVSKKIQR